MQTVWNDSHGLEILLVFCFSLTFPVCLALFVSIALYTLLVLLLYSALTLEKRCFLNKSNFLRDAWSLFTVYVCLCFNPSYSPAAMAILVIVWHKDLLQREHTHPPFHLFICRVLSASGSKICIHNRMTPGPKCRPKLDLIEYSSRNNCHPHLTDHYSEKKP